MNNTTTKNTQSAQLNAASSELKFVSSFMALHMSALSFLQERSINLFNNTNPGENQTTRKPLLTLINMKNQTKKQILTSCLIALSSLFLANGAFAVTKTSVANGNWSSSSTWNPSGAPASGDDVVINTSVTMNVSSISIAKLTINSGKTFTNTGELTVSGNLIGSGTLTQSATGILILGGTNTVNTFSVSTAGNIVKYNSASAQDIRTASYKNLVITGVGVKTTLADLTVADLTVDANSTMTIGTGFKLDVSGDFLNNGTFNGSTDDVTFQGNFENNGTFTAGSGTHTFKGSSKTISGTSIISIPTVVFDGNNSGSYTNNGNLAVTSSLSGIDNADLIQGSTGILTIGGTLSTKDLSLTVTATGNTVVYSSTISQTVINKTYYNLTLNGSTKTLSGSMASISGNLTLENGATVSTAKNLTINGNLNIGTGSTFSMGAYTLTIAGDLTNSGTFTGSANNVSVGGNITNNNTFTATNASPTYTLTGASKSINGSFTIANLTVSGSYTNNSTLSTTNLAITGSLINNGSITVSNLLSGAGSLTQNADKTLTLSGITPTITTLTATASGNTVTYSGASQAILNTPYAKLVVSGTGKTYPAGLSTIPGNVELTNSANFTTTNNLTIEKDLIIGAGSTFTMGGSYTLTVKGNYTNNGTFTGNTANITFNGTAAQAIGGTASTNNFKVLTINNANGVTLNSNVNIYNTLTVSAGALASNGKLTIKSVDSTNTGTARITAIGSGASITGNVTVERFINANRRDFRFLSSAVKNVTIFNNWQEGGSSDAGYGTQISGASSVNANPGINATTGLDNTPSLFNSIFTMTSASTWVALNNSKVNYTPGLGYNLYIRGDRTNNLYTSTPPTTNVQTILRTTGALNQGNIALAINSGWVLLGNPYASAIDWSNSAWATDRTGKIDNAIYVRNPDVTPNTSGAINYYACHNGTVGINGWTAFGPIIESSQGFIVKSISAHTITFKEAYKTSSLGRGYFKNNSVADLLRIEYLFDGIHSDEIAINFRDGGKAIVDGSVDASSMGSATFGLASLKNGSRLSINTRPVFETVDTISLSVAANRTGRFALKFTDIGTFAGMTQIVLIDKFLNKMINIDQTVTYNFDITADLNSKGNNRFVLLFSKVGTAAFTTGILNATENVSNVSLYPNPATSTINLACNNANVKDFSYEIYNQMGQSVSAGAGNFTNGNVEAVNIDILDKGIYFVKILYNNNAEIIRFVK